MSVIRLADGLFVEPSTVTVVRALPPREAKGRQMPAAVVVTLISGKFEILPCGNYEDALDLADEIGEALGIT